MDKAIHYTMLKDTSRVVCEEPEVRTLDGDTPQRVVSADGYDVLYRIPGACRGKSLVRLVIFLARFVLLHGEGLRIGALQRLGTCGQNQEVSCKR